uniref:ATP synthase subunit a n=1 Tax=Riccardoella tokyoensis TaxID=2073164 RepID=A0A7R7UNM3_9ACAR|nr:ATPase subunit 6 [Riccardoella tokyoensis]
MKMMMNMFSIFDPSYYYLKLNWMTYLMPMYMIMTNKFKFMNKWNLMAMSMWLNIYKEIKNLMKTKFNKENMLFIMTIFLMILIMNSMSMMPFIYTQMSQISISFPMAMIMWMAMMMYGWMNNFKMMMINMVPMSTPMFLMMFMVIIEMMSNMIRPITLSIRLTANMVAGHLLMSLLSNFMTLKMTNMMMMLMPMLFLCSLELMVSFIQAYVFITLLTLYYNEVL